MDTSKCKFCKKKKKMITVEKGLGWTSRLLCPDKKCKGHIPEKPPVYTGDKMENFSYRAGYFMDKAQNQRREAEAAAKGETNPYNNIDDITGGMYEGEVQ